MHSDEVFKKALRLIGGWKRGIFKNIHAKMEDVA